MAREKRSSSPRSFGRCASSIETAGLRYKAFEAALFIQNLTDERALLSIDRERGLRARYGYQTNQPRTIGVTLRQTF